MVLDIRPARLLSRCEAGGVAFVRYEALSARRADGATRLEAQGGVAVARADWLSEEIRVERAGSSLVWLELARPSSRAGAFGEEDVEASESSESEVEGEVAEGEARAGEARPRRERTDSSDPEWEPGDEV